MEFLYSMLQQTGFNHPLHPPFTHLPMGLVIGAFIFLLAAPLFKGASLMSAARYCMVLALLSLFPAVFLGVTDWWHYYNGAWIFPIKMKIFLTGGLLIFLTSTIAVEIRKIGGYVTKLILYFICVITMVMLGFFGGGLVFPDTSKNTLSQFPEGEMLYAKFCAKCHPQGGNSIDPTLPVIGSLRMKDLNTFSKFNRNPLMADGSTGIMPAFAKETISDSEMKSLYQYTALLTQKKPTPK